MSYPTFTAFSPGGGFKASEWRDFWCSLTEAQQTRIRDKARYEHCSLSAVMCDWPSILEGTE